MLPRKYVLLVAQHEMQYGSREDRAERAYLRRLYPRRTHSVKPKTYRATASSRQVVKSPQTLKIG